MAGDDLIFFTSGTTINATAYATGKVNSSSPNRQRGSRPEAIVATDDTEMTHGQPQKHPPSPVQSSPVMDISRTQIFIYECTHEHMPIPG
ncbi:hypothetical protein ZHAS_00019389 [Anopheles sinensis]|uniref:Uncharacterized protein n=1 Tax=Anopheles sinensis TaxID=74873 RepID=A0A084WM88_ANOSI|nr:hypothetical protein ZHAS_00019389 [Anopheles sinensis]